MFECGVGGRWWRADSQRLSRSFPGPFSSFSVDWVRWGRARERAAPQAGRLACLDATRHICQPSGLISTSIPITGQMKMTKIVMTTISSRLAGTPTLKNSPELNCLLS